MQVQNISGTQDRACGCGSWLKHWENFNENGKKVKRCFGNYCSNPAELGAHVRLISLGSADARPEYIVPFCSEHNRKGSDCIIDIDANNLGDLASADKSLTCG